MRQQCIAAVTKAALGMGRKLVPKDLDKIEDRIRQAREDLAVEQGDKFALLTPGEQIKQGAERVSKDIIAQYRRKAQNVQRAVQAKVNADSFLEAQSKKGENRVDAINRINVTDQDLGANVSSVEQERRGIYAFAARNIVDMWMATKQFAGFWTNKAAVRDFVREVNGEHTGNAEAAKAAKKWTDTSEMLRKQYNELGGNIRKLAYGYLPHKWDVYKMVKMTGDEFAKYIVPLLNRDRYRNENGQRKSTAELEEMAKAIHFNSTTDSSFLGKPGSLGERHQERRVLHFKDADSWLDVNAKLGSGSVMEAMLGHANQMSKEIAAMKVWGPSPDATFHQVLKGAVEKEKEANPKAQDKIQGKATIAQSMYNAAIGRLGPIGNPTIARAFQNIRSINLFKLGSSALSAISDGSNITAVSKVWSIPYLRRYLYGLKAWFSKDFRQNLISQGIGLETMAHGVARYGEENLSHGILGKFAQGFLHAVGVNFEDTVRRTATGAMLMNDIERMAAKNKTMATLDPHDNAVILNRGVKPEDWEVWRAAGKDLSADTIANIPDAAIAHLGNPDTIRRDAAQKLIGVALSDVDTIVPLMTAKTVGNIEAKGYVGKRGTIGGELIRSFLTFKSFPLSNFQNHWDRMNSQEGLGKAAYAAQIIATSTIMGAITVQLKAMAAGENPQDMTDPKYWGRAVVQGGALGLYFDILAGTMTNLHGDRPKDAASIVADQLGPTVGTAKDILGLLRLPGKDQELSDYGNKEGEALARIFNGMAPKPFYAKAALDRLVFQQILDYFNPGYADRAKENLQKNYNSTYYWPVSSAGRVEPPEAPNLRTAIGER